ncbi:hypothetical protein CWE08_00685 [Aliidiomarina iranensis]|uniref:Flagellar hook-length control protein-like C-terminal domain-containing protein n=1 Tax=Aliidiomarina iranensis TaxID=1434071 RepID=A0A432W1V7_9GAMM|nr:flagellar hook-length control protein FliK [Aliidiomarina iranensis]RUO23204.1 hypothetical protein CWE08_00685 [Aliidiomarina iranensis]
MLNMMVLNTAQPASQGVTGTKAGSAADSADFAARLQDLVAAQSNPTLPDYQAPGAKHTPQEVLFNPEIEYSLPQDKKPLPGDPMELLPIDEHGPAMLSGMLSGTLSGMPAENSGALSQAAAMAANPGENDMLSRITQAQNLNQQMVQHVAKQELQTPPIKSNHSDGLQAIAGQQAVSNSANGATNVNAIPLSAMAETLQAGNPQLAQNNGQTLTPSQTAALQMAMQLTGQERASLPAGALADKNPILTDTKLTQAGNLPNWQPLATPLPIKQALPVNDSAFHVASQAAAAGGAELGANLSTSIISNAEQANMLAQQAAGSSIASPSASPSTTLSAPLASNAWQQQLSQQVVNMNIRQDNHVALRLHPAELGPLMINLKMDDQAASLQFSASNANVRAAVENAIPQLREILAEQGIELAESAINDGQSQQQNEEQRSGSAELADNSGNTQTLAADANAEQEVEVQMGNGKIDLYA